MLILHSFKSNTIYESYFVVNFQTWLNLTVDSIWFFSGLCLERPGCECVPKKTRQVKINIVMGVNSSSTLQVCSSIDIEEHRGPCKCKCLIKQCHYNQVFNRDLCQCNCKDSFGVLKRDCLTNGGGRATNFWDDDTCSCKCRPRRCVKGHYQGIN